MMTQMVYQEAVRQEGDPTHAPASRVTPFGGAVPPRAAERSGTPVRDWWQAPTEEGVAPVRVEVEEVASLDGEPPQAPTPREQARQTD